MSNPKFSAQLSKWLASNGRKTVGSMLHVFDEKSFAFIFIILMIFPAAPLPTGGITHVFEIIVILLALQLLIGRRELWLPKKLRNVELSKNTRTKILPFLVKRVEFLEKFSKPRFALVIKNKWFRVQLGFFVVIFTLAAFLAPPFTGLDTLPSAGVVLIALGVMLEDISVIAMGYVIGSIGVAIAIILGETIYMAAKTFL